MLFRMNIVGTNIIGAILDEELNLVDKFKTENGVIKGPEYNLERLILEIEIILDINTFFELFYKVVGVPLEKIYI